MSTLYRYGISALSRESHVIAKNEELLVDKKTGQILLKRQDGRIMSYDSQTRFISSVETFKNKCREFGIRGMIYAFMLDNKPLPSAFDNGEDILIGDETLLLANCKKFLLQLDVDVFDNETAFGDPQTLSTLKCIITYIQDDQEYSMDVSILDLNSHVVELPEKSDVVITSIQIVDESSNNSHYTINNILAAVI